jgi:hypothetical protein
MRPDPCPARQKDPLPRDHDQGDPDDQHRHLRHTAASLMIQSGYPPKMLQEIMGHASITTTLDLYGHLYPGEMDRYEDRLDDAATASDAAKMRPDTDENEDQDGEDDEE